MGQCCCDQVAVEPTFTVNQKNKNQQILEQKRELSAVFEVQNQKNEQNILNFMLPKYWIKNRDQQQKMTCSICYELVKNPCRCSGPCKALFCISCVDNWKKQKSRALCPQKCSQNFQVQQIEMQQIQFLCPFNKQKCKIVIKGIDQFQGHEKICQHIPTEIKKQIQYKHSYKCRHGHSLEYHVTTFKQSFNKVCASCGQTKLSKYFCRKCHQSYCFQCRELQCSKSGCPKSHKWVYYPNVTQNNNYTCDFCGQNPCLKGNGFYDDSFCNLSSCLKCFSKFSERLPQVCKQIQINNYYQCQKKHPLETLIQAKRTVCQLCFTKKQCYRSCKKCQVYFCLECKLPQISNSKCQRKHNYIKKAVEPNQKNPQGQDKCKRCFKNQVQYQDLACKVKLCNQCYDYSQQIKEMEIQMVLPQYTCQNKHPLRYAPLKRSELRECQFCKNIVQSIMHCAICQQWTFYCCSCIPPKPQVCYLNHKLIKQQYESAAMCHICQQIKRQSFYSCKQNCALRQCEQCYQKMNQFYNSRKDFIFKNQKQMISRLGLLLLIMRLQEDLHDSNQQQVRQENIQQNQQQHQPDLSF